VVGTQQYLKASVLEAVKLMAYRGYLRDGVSNKGKGWLVDPSVHFQH
jgi:hypothetical protein